MSIKSNSENSQEKKLGKPLDCAYWKKTNPIPNLEDAQQEFKSLLKNKTFSTENTIPVVKALFV
jgi:hypothetical protein